MRNRVYNLFIMLLIGLAPILVACAGDGGTGPGGLGKNVTVSYALANGCSHPDTPTDSVNMGTIEFENNTDVPVMPAQIAVELVGSTPTAVPMYLFGASYRYADNSIIPNLDAQQDSDNSYIVFSTLPTIAPGGTFRAKVRGSVPLPTAGLYVFRMIPDSVKAKTASGGDVEISMGLNEFSLRIADDCT